MDISLTWNRDVDRENTVQDSAYTRRYRRWFVDFRTQLAFDDEFLACTVHDLSPGGACVALGKGIEFQMGKRLSFELPGYGLIPAEVRYDANGYLGLMFLHDREGELEVGRYLVAVEENRRQTERHDVEIDTTMVAGGVDATCRIDNISETGARVLLDDTRHIMSGQQISVYLLGSGSVSATVQWVNDSEIGIAFLNKLSNAPQLTARPPLWMSAAKSAGTFAQFRENKPRHLHS